MSSRDRPSERGRTAAPQRPAEPPAAARSLRADDLTTWADLYDLLPHNQRNRLLLLAADQPVSANQLPDAAGGSPLLPRLFAGDVDSLPPLPAAPPLDDLPAEFDPHQRDAVARLLAAPDVCLIQGLPGTGKSRVIAEAVARAAARGERVAVLAPGAAALDRLAELLDGRPAVVPLRLVAANESVATLPPAAARATFDIRCRLVHDETLARANTRVKDAAERIARREAEVAVYDHLADLAGQSERIAARRAELTAAASAAAEPPADVERLRHEAAAHETAAADLRPLAEALDKGRWWTGTYWRAKFASDPASRVADLEAKRDRALADAAAAVARQTAMASSRGQTADELAALATDAALVADKWTQAVRQLTDSPTPGEPTAAAVASARSQWEALRDADRRDADAARAWADGLDDLLASLPERYAEAVNVVFATPATLAADRRFQQPFDLLVFDDAHFATREDLEAAAKRARRWAFVGEPMAERDVAQLDGPPRGDRRPAPRSATRGAFQRLWQFLHCDPWQREGDRVVCRLRPVPAALRPYVACEAVADRPDVELRIVAPPGGDAQLAEVVFPAGTDVCAAKEYVFQQLGEAPLRQRADGPHWREDGERIVLHLHGRCDAASRVAALEGGVSELLADVPNGWATCGIAFTKAAGWDRARAEAWAEQHVGRHDGGRAIRLETPHRLGVGLGGIVADLLGAGPYRGEVPHAGSAEFVPVPSLPLDRNGHTNGHSASRPGLDARGGAGLETDLSDPRQRATLPPDLQAALPGHGIVNLTEARAVAKMLGQIEGSVALALTHAQAELIRLLAPGAAVGVPPAWRQREVPAVVVSLVRSHTHRAVSYGDGEDWLALAASRGRRLILVGDAGTLARRAAWDGPLDRLDAVAAKRERELATQLVRYLQGKGRYGRAFRLAEGTHP